MKANIALALALALGSAACGNYESVRSADISTLPSDAVRFAATSGLTANFLISDSQYTGALGTSASCSQDFNGCYSRERGCVPVSGI